MLINIILALALADPFYSLHREVDRLFDDFMGCSFGLTRFGDFTDRFSSY